MQQQGGLEQSDPESHPESDPDWTIRTGRGMPAARSRSNGSWVGFLAILIAAHLWVGACSSRPKPVDACLRLDAATNLNFHNGQSHTLTLLAFPLSSPVGFEHTRVEELLAGATPPGVEGSPIQFAIKPGEQDREFEELFPAGTLFLGVIANYYRAPGDPEGSRKQVVPARCGWRTPRLSLAAKDVYLD